MDANLQHPFQIANREDWAIAGDPAALSYDPERRVLRLTSARSRSLVEDEATARVRLAEVPGSLDRFGTSASWEAGQGRVVAAGAFPGTVPIHTALPGADVTDVCVGYDGALYLAEDGRVVIRDLRDRWEPVSVQAAGGVAAWRLAAVPGGGVYVLDGTARRVARVVGLPMRTLRSAFAPEVFRPDPEDPDPPRMQPLPGAVIPPDEEPIAIAASPDGRVALLTWRENEEARLRVLDAAGRFGAPRVLDGARFPYSLSFVDAERVAVLLSGLPGRPIIEALVYPLPAEPANPSPTATQVLPLGDIYPLRDHTGGPFLHTMEYPSIYPTLAAPGSRRLIRIASPSFLSEGKAANARPLDSGAAHTLWHRLYVEASIPAGCTARVFLAATEEPAAPAEPSDWYEHRFGIADVEPADTDVPRGAWLRERSEIPFHPGFLGCASRKDRAGLFTALVQRSGRRVRTLTGRYLWVNVELLGNGRSTPELAALRAYAPRRSYAQYLPELYRETLFGPDGDDAGQATRPDFLERFLGLFESVMTPLEDRIRDAHVLTTPAGVPAEGLEWLASWIGFTFVQGLPEKRRRALLANAAELYVRRGTLEGLELALNLVTDGGVERGTVVVIEDFRLRRTFATILGADLSTEDDPLLPGLSISGNSLVGDTLFLGDEQAKEFLALFGAGVEISASEKAAVSLLFDRLAHRATVLVHADTSAEDLGLIGALVDREAPAHVEVKVLTATQRFLIGIASLLGIDTFLGRKPPLGSARVDVTSLGRGDTVSHLPSLDPRLGSSPLEEPVALLAPVVPAAAGQPYTLDGSASHAAPGRKLVRYRWTLIR